jgi:hypothetical protein
MSKSNDKTFTEAVTEFNKFQGKMEESKTNIERRLSEISIKLIAIEAAANVAMKDHEKVEVMFQGVQADTVRQQTTNVNQGNENTAMGKWQKDQDSSIQHLEAQKQTIEYKMSGKDFAKLLGIMSAVMLPSVAVITFVIIRLVVG